MIPDLDIMGMAQEGIRPEQIGISRHLHLLHLGENLYLYARGI
jgi:hypothetical protein